MGAFDTEDTFLTQNRADLARQFTHGPVETRRNPFRMLGGALKVATASGSPAGVRARSTEEVMSVVNLNDPRSLAVGAKLLQGAGNYEAAWKLAERARQLMPGPAEPTAGPEEPWFDDKNQLIGVKQKDKTGKYQYTRYKQTPLVSNTFGTREKTKFALEEFKIANQAANAAQKTINNLDFIDRAMTGIETGSLTDWRVSINQLASSLNLPVDENIGNLESARTAMGNLVMAALDNFPGQISNQERQFLEGRMPALTQTAEGRAAISGLLRKIAERAMVKRDMMQKYIRGNNPELTPEEGITFYDEWNAYIDANPLFDNPQDIGVGTFAVDAAGTRFQLHMDGSWRDESGNLYGAEKP